MPVRALTIDFWNTMVVSRKNGPRRQAQRIEHLLRVVHAARPDLSEAVIEEAYHEASRRFQATWRTQHTTPTTSELIHGIWQVLNLTVPEHEHGETVRVFEEGILFGPPDLAEGLEEALAWAAENYRLGIISDTMFSPGRVIRRLLARRNLLHFFDAFVFSDETGFSKPDVRAFSQAGTALGVAEHEIAHIGDLRRTDVAGARQAGLKAILFTGIHEDAEATPAPDAVLPHWNTLADVLTHL